MMMTSGFFRLLPDIPKPVWRYPISYINYGAWALQVTSPENHTAPNNSQRTIGNANTKRREEKQVLRDKAKQNKFNKNEIP